MVDSLLATIKGRKVRNKQYNEVNNRTCCISGAATVAESLAETVPESAGRIIIIGIDIGLDFAITGGDWTDSSAICAPANLVCNEATDDTGADDSLEIVELEEIEEGATALLLRAAIRAAIPPLAELGAVFVTDW